MNRVFASGLLWLIALGCGSPDKQSISDTKPTGTVDTAAVSQASDAGGPRLSPTHPGWRQANCASCHQTTSLEEIHGVPAPKPPACVSCHGYNGAKHKDHAADPVADCASCHAEGNLKSSHLDLYRIPSECSTCHVHPTTPDGT